MRGVRAVAALLALGVAPRAEAQVETALAPPAVMLFSTPEAESLAGRIEAELVAAGLAPRRVPVAAATRFEDLAALTMAEHAAGAVRVDPDGTGAEMWIADPATGRVQLRQSLSADGSLAMASVIAVRTAEFLRVSLLPPAPPPRVSPPVAPPPVVTAVPTARPPRTLLRLAVAPAWLESAGGVGAALSLAAVIAVQGRRLGAEALVLAPVTAGRFDAPEGSTRVHVTLAGVGARARWATGAPWKGDAAVGAAGALVRAEGVPAVGFTGAVKELRGAAFYARVGASYDLAPWLALRLDAILADLTPRAVIGVDDRTPATWGRPFGAALLGLEAGIL